MKQDGCSKGELAAGNIAIIGFMGSGKSTVGRVLAARMGWEFVDLDEVIASRAGMSVAEIFSQRGEEWFRRRESEALADVLRGRGKVVACGGGVVKDAGNARVLRENCRVFYLKILPETAVRRLQGTSERPLLQGRDLKEAVAEMMDEREDMYAQTAHDIIAADSATPERIAEELERRWRR